MITSVGYRRNELSPPRGRQVAAVLSLAIAIAAAGPASAGDDRLLAQCWPAEALRAKADEHLILKSAASRQSSAWRTPVLGPPPPAAAMTGSIRRVALPPGKKLVALTIDLCESSGEIAGYDGAVFDALRAARAKATVFAGGKWLQSHPERAQQLIADPLLELASHGWAHRNVRGLADAALAQEIRGPEAAFQSQRAALLARQCAAAVPGAAGRIQPSLTLYRFPFGACHAGSLRAVADAGMLAVQWDISTGDSSASETAAAITRSIVDRARPGSIILAHGNGRGHHTAQALPEAIRQLRVKGFELVTVSELLAAGKPVIAETCYDSRPGDTDRYDKLFAPRPPRPDKSDAIPPRPLPR